MTTPASTTRFTDRVADYVRYRPDYPADVRAALESEFGLAAGHVIADVGSGTGISAELFLRAGYRVLAVEPNDAMRTAAEEWLAPKYPQFASIAATAEATTLPDASVDWVVAAQAFHWFDVDACQAEFRRILRPQADAPNLSRIDAAPAAGRVVLLWNNRREDTPFLAAYERLLREFAVDYERVKHQQVEEDGRLERFFAPGYQRRTFPNVQQLDFDGLAGRLRSSSYMPGPEHARFDDMLRALRVLFDKFASGGTVPMEYETRLYVGTPRA